VVYKAISQVFFQTASYNLSMVSPSTHWTKYSLLPTF